MDNNQVPENRPPTEAEKEGVRHLIGLIDNLMEGLETLSRIQGSNFLGKEKLPIHALNNRVNDHLKILRDVFVNSKGEKNQIIQCISLLMTTKNMLESIRENLMSHDFIQQEMKDASEKVASKLLTSRNDPATFNRISRGISPRYGGRN